MKTVQMSGDREDAEVITGEGTFKDRKTAGYGLRSLITEAVTVVIILAVVFTFIFGITVQRGNDMYPALKDGDIILFYRQGDPVNTEICVYRAAGEIHTGRIAASAGTVISSTADMQLTFNGIYMPPSAADGIYDRTYAADGQPLPVTVKDGHYFMLGDNRSDARDSREFGQISRKSIQGRVIAVLRIR